MTETAVAERDIAAIQSSDWPHRDLGVVAGFRDAGFQAVFRQSVIDDVHLHGQSNTGIEVCGVLIGNGYVDEHGPYLLIEHCIHGKETRGHSTNVTFTAETWQHIQETMDHDYPDKKMVGWYHTHPGFGIFLSGMDQFICDNFFNLPWQVAFVYDPLSGEEGNFVWRSGKTKREPTLIEDDVTPIAADIPLISVESATAVLPSAEMPSTGATATGAPSTGASSARPRFSGFRAGAHAGNHAGTHPGSMLTNDKIIELLERVHRLERRQKLLVVAMAFILAFVTMWAWEFTPVTPSPVKSAAPSLVNPVPISPVKPAARPTVVPPVGIPVPDPSTQPML